MSYRVGKMGYLSVGDIWSVIHWDSEIVLESEKGYVYWRGPCMDTPKGYMDSKVIYVNPFDKGVRLMLKGD